jgi:hypothetical protein
VGELVGVDSISAKMLKHAPNNAFARADIPGQTDDVFFRPFSQNNTSNRQLILRFYLCMIRMSKDEGR